MPRLIALSFALLSGVLLALCFPRFNVEALVWVWAAPLLISLWWLPRPETGRRFWRGFGLGYLTGLAFFGINLAWIHEVTLVGAIIFPFYLALFLAVWAGLSTTIGRPRDAQLHTPPDSEAKPSLFRTSFHSLRCAFFNAATWVTLEWLRGYLLTGFGWNGLGVAFHDNLNLIQIAEITGVTGLSFLPMFAGCVLVITVRRFQLEIRHQQLRPHLDFGVALAAVAATFLYGLNHTLKPKGDGPSVKCVLVQLAIPQELKWDPAQAPNIIADLQAFTRTYASTTDPDLIIWPESSLPTPLFADPANDPIINGLLEEDDFALMLGTNEYDLVNDKVFNSAVLVQESLQSADLQLYRKIHLVPFGEFIPFRERLPFLDAWLKDLIPGDFTRGTSTEPLPFPDKDLQVIPLICFEDTVGRLARRFVRPEAQFMVNMTNDGWFRRSPAAEQHVANARFRCVELRRPMARACNTGVTCLIDAQGRMISKLEDPDEGIFVKGALVGALPIADAAPLTFYARFGDLFSGIMAALAILLMIRHHHTASS